MGEVYKARDTRLDRHVAIKVLSPGAATDPRGRAHFAHEARAIARLSHPRICALHEMGHQDGVDFLVMEYLEGETLAARLRKGPMPLAQALRTAVEIAGALATAHAQGIVHRDLKPSNVMLTAGGAKLLDFGLARLRAPTGSALSPASGALPSSQTAPGLIAGTLPYMAPEQLEGNEVVQRRKPPHLRQHRSADRRRHLGSAPGRQARAVSGCPHHGRRALRHALARRTVAGVHLERDRYLRGVRRIVSCDRIQAAGFDAGRLRAALAT
jgi:serine/threonine protein kinase